MALSMAASLLLALRCSVAAADQIGCAQPSVSLMAMEVRPQSQVTCSVPPPSVS